MTREEIIEMAKKSKMPYFFMDKDIVNLEKLQDFVEFAITKEREACAKCCDVFADDKYATGNFLAMVIRARGQE